MCFVCCCSNLDRKIGDLNTTGSTALGPALAISAGVISDIPESEVILCTDGAPNVGIGRIPADAEFYKTVKILYQIVRY